jgi:hypothetical protein
LEHYRKAGSHAFDPPTTYDRDLPVVLSRSGAPMVGLDEHRRNVQELDSWWRSGRVSTSSLDAVLDDIVARCRELNLRGWSRA